ncbi:MAG: hypothetical protein Q9160_003236 [Pyrenula sp. 1 TL-2023]
MLHLPPCATVSDSHYSIGIYTHDAYAKLDDVMPSRLSSSEGAQNAATSALQPEVATVEAFTDSTFDAVAYLNDALPSLSLISPTQTQAARTSRLNDASSNMQALLSRINAQHVRLTNTLTQLTDEILRSGSRLAYEVEILRGDTIGLSETLTDGLQNEIEQFIVDEPSAESEKEAHNSSTLKAVKDPEALSQLRVLSQVRTRLEEVVNTFGQAMEWPLPPSKLSLTSSFISVSGPDAGPDSHSREEKGQEIAKQLKSQITTLLEQNGGGIIGVEAASKQVQILRNLSQVWKGTAEERARTRFVDGLEKLVEDRRTIVEGSLQSQRHADDLRSGSRTGEDQKGRRDAVSSGGGLFRNLQRLREEIYLD